jgi:uncharacterized protein (TIGR02145 family)
MMFRILALLLLPVICLAQVNSNGEKSTGELSNEISPNEMKRNASFNLEEIKVRWKKAALENCQGVPCVSISPPGPVPFIAATPTGPTSARVTFGTPSSDGGSPITGYKVTATPTTTAPGKRKSSGTIIVEGKESPIDIPDLTLGVNYTFSVIALNAAGVSPPVNTTTTVTPCILNTASAALTNPTLIVNTATNITIATTGATGISNAGVSGSNGLPAGVSAAFASNTITISGTPTATGTFNYSIPLTGGCGSINATGTITVTAAPSFTCGTSTIADYNNINAYTTVSIGNQCWMKENLRTRFYNDGTEIRFDNSGGPGGTTNQTWTTMGSIGAYTIYAHDSTPTTGNLAIYGYLYNWFAAAGFPTYAPGEISTKNICPVGWHVPTDSDWNKLVKYLDSGADTTSGNPTQSATAGSYMKSMGNTYWTSQNTGTDNSSGFSALPGGSRNNNGSFNDITNYAFFWSATESFQVLEAWNRKLSFDSGNVNRDYSIEMVDGASVRCLRD